MTKRLFVGLAVSVVSCAAAATTMDAVKENFVRVLKHANPEIRAQVRKLAAVPESGDANVKSVLETLGVAPERVAALVRDQSPDGTWPDVDYKTVTRSCWPVRAHLENMKDLARAPRTPETEAAYRRALAVWLDGDFVNPNWWWNEIGAPLAIGASALLMDDCLAPAERAGVIRKMGPSKIRMTGQNRVWLSECVLMRALLEGNEAEARAARDAIVGEIALSGTVEGIQSDWSFHQHGNMAQFGNYGASYVVTLPRLAAVFAGTDWAISDAQYEILENLIDKGFRPTVWRGAMDVGSIGRQFTDNAARLKGAAPLVGAGWLTLSGRPSAMRILRDCLADNRGEPAKVPHLGLTWFPTSAMGMYRTADWMISVKCETKSVKGTELVNEDNLLGAHLADGALFTYVTGDEYLDVYPFWNWRRVPGTTSYDADGVDWKSRNAADVAEADGDRVRFVLDRDGLKATTEWAFSPAGADVSVTGISSAKDVPVVTTVEQSVAAPNASWRRAGDGIVAVNGTILYELPANAVVRVEERRGNWKRHMGVLSAAVVTGRVFEVTIPHGTRPSNASCAWRVRPLGALDGLIAACEAHFRNMIKEVEKKSPTGLPRALNGDGSLKTVQPKDWCSGFFPGGLWYLYELTGKDEWRAAAEAFTERLVEPLRHDANNHDVGFRTYCSAGNGLRLTGNPRYADFLHDTAAALRTRYDDGLGLIRSWNSPDARRDYFRPSFVVIIDNMMNLELLEWDAKNGGDAKSDLIARSQADKTDAHHFRPDGSAYHILAYNPETRRIHGVYAGQGASVDGTWSRGQSWAIYGFTVMHRETKDPRYLDRALSAARFWMEHPNLPADGVPYWDFSAPGEERDASAAAIAASAFFELARHAPDGSARELRACAERTLLSLASPAYFARPGENGHFLIKHCVGCKPHGGEIDVPLVYADYYFLEALARFRGKGM